MRRWVERALPWLCLVAVAVVAALQARGVMYILAAALLSGSPVVDRPLHAPPLTQPENPSGVAILHRNPFDSRTGPLDVAPPPPSSLPPPTSSAQGVETCSFGYTTLIVATASSHALAAITGQDGKSALYRVGDELGGHVVHAIGWDAIVLDGDGVRCTMRLGEKNARPEKKRTAKPATRRRRAQVPEAIAGKIERVSDTEFVVDRSAIDAILESQAQLMRGVRVRPQGAGGEGAGLRLGRVRRGTLLDLIGLRTGDVVRAINGFDLADPQRALEAYGRLRTADDLKLELQREGKPVHIDYRIR
jgi:general secretion pathway protein C